MKSKNTDDQNNLFRVSNNKSKQDKNQVSEWHLHTK